MRPMLPSSPTATSHTTSPTRSSLSTPARFSSASHSSTLESDSQSPPGDGTNTYNTGARRARYNGDWKTEGECRGAGRWVAVFPWCECENNDGDGDGVR